MIRSILALTAITVICTLLTACGDDTSGAANQPGRGSRPVSTEKKTPPGSEGVGEPASKAGG